MNEIRVVRTALFNPGAIKSNPVKIRAVGRVSTYANGAPPLITKAPRIQAVLRKPVQFDPGAVKPESAVSFRASAKATVLIVGRASAKATAKPQSYSAEARAKSHVTIAVGTGALSKPHDIKSASAKLTLVPGPIVPSRERSYITASSKSNVSYARLGLSHDRKIARAKADFGSFLGSRSPSFSWR